MRRALEESAIYLTVLSLFGLLLTAIAFAASCHADRVTLRAAGDSGGREVNRKVNRAALVLALCVGCAGGGEPGNALLPGSRTPVAVGDAAADLAGDAGGDLAADAQVPALEAGAPELPAPAPDVGAPPDVAPAFPACAEDVNPEGCRETGECRTAAGRVCYVCNVTAPCEWSKNLTRPGGSMCALPRICVPAAMGCAVMAGGERCVSVMRDGGQ